MPIRRSPNSVVTPLHSFRKPGHHDQEPVVTLPRNRWSPSPGTGGHLPQECAPNNRHNINDINSFMVFTDGERRL